MFFLGKTLLVQADSKQFSCDFTFDFLPRHNLNRQANCIGDTKNNEFCMNQDTIVQMSPLNKIN